MVAHPEVELSALDAARVTLARAREHALGLQHTDGWWQGELETNVTMDAEDLLLRQFLGVRDDAATAAAARWIRSQQREDGTWANFYGGPADLSTTVEAYVALRLAGDEPDAPHMKRACDWILSQGGVEATRVFTRLWLALSGRWSWDDLPVIPPELIYLPAWFPLNIYDWGCWARQTIVALAVVQSFRPSRPLPFTIDELKTGGPHGRAPRPRRTLDARPLPGPRTSAGPLVLRLHRPGPGPAPLPAGEVGAAGRAAPLRGVDHRPPGARRLLGRHPAAVGVLADGAEPARLRPGPPADGPRAGRPGPVHDHRGRPDGPIRRLEACQSPVWDTVLMMIGLADAGLPSDHPALVEAGEWVLNEEIRGPADWQVRRAALAPGGWAFEFDNDNYPDTDDTAEVVLALRRVALPAAEAKPAIDRGLRWLAGMQSKDGGWGAFDADNTRALVNKLPFCDFGAVIDPPSADVTAHIVEAFAAEGQADHPAVRRGALWLLRAQEPDGSWFGRWGANYVYGTGAVVPALIAAGVRPSKPAIRRAVAWLEAHQNPDGGWGEDLRSYDDASLAGRGTSTASQTAWALLALLAAGEHDSAATEQGIRWLARTQRDDGSWDEPQYTGTGFPGDFYINYHLYRLAFPLSALGRYVGAQPGGSA